MRLLFALAFAGTLLAPAPAVAQATSSCTVNLDRWYADAPLLPASVQVGGIERTEPPYNLHIVAPCGADWIEGVQVKFRNMTNKVITGVWVGLDFADAERPSLRRLPYSFHLGETPERSTYKPDKTKAHVVQHTALQNAPRSEVIVVLKPEYANIKKVIETEQSVDTIHAVWVKIVQVYFADGTVYNGWYQKPDPNDPTAYIKADPADFGRAARMQ